MLSMLEIFTDKIDEILLKSMEKYFKEEFKDYGNYKVYFNSKSNFRIHYEKGFLSITLAEQGSKNQHDIKKFIYNYFKEDIICVKLYGDLEKSAFKNVLSEMNIIQI